MIFFKLIIIMVGENRQLESKREKEEKFNFWK